MTSELACLGVVLWWTASVAAAMEAAGPIVPCETEGQRVADRGSCTRFHVCRVSDDVFVTDLLVCPDSMVYDMVSSSCVESVGGYLQDPAGCTTFYGCHPTRERSEGFVRQHYSCSGDLRFHPLERFCTFKTRVPDDMCNSPNSEQSIIGTDTAARRDTSRDNKVARSGIPSSSDSTDRGGFMAYTGDADTNTQPGNDFPELPSMSVGSKRKTIRDTTASMNSGKNTESIGSPPGLVMEHASGSESERDAASDVQDFWTRSEMNYNSSDDATPTPEPVVSSEVSQAEPELTHIQVTDVNTQAMAGEGSQEATHITPVKSDSQETKPTFDSNSERLTHLVKGKMNQLTQEQPAHLFSEHSHNLASEQTNQMTEDQKQDYLSDDRPQQLTNEPSFSLTEDQHHLSNERPHHLTNELLHHLSMNQPVNNADRSVNATLLELAYNSDVSQMTRDEEPKEPWSEQALTSSAVVHSAIDTMPVKSHSEHDMTSADDQTSHEFGTVTMTFKYESSAEADDSLAWDGGMSGAKFNGESQKHPTTMKSKLLDILLTADNTDPLNYNDKLSEKSAYNWGTGSTMSSYDLDAFETNSHLLS